MECVKRRLAKKLILPLEQQFPFTCEICTERKPYNKSFSVKGCCHSYCSDCLVKYIDIKLQSKVIHILCPGLGCTSQLDPDNCRPIIADKMFDHWWAALYESWLPQACKLYCPNKTCSALLFIDADGSRGPMLACPYCQQRLCVHCKVMWHEGIGCEEFYWRNKEEDEKEDALLHQLASENQWKQCPNCHIYISHYDSASCDVMLCRSCGCGFCYGCGTAYGGHGAHIPHTEINELWAVNVPLRRALIKGYRPVVHETYNLEAFRVIRDFHLGALPKVFDLFSQIDILVKDRRWTCVIFYVFFARNHICRFVVRLRRDVCDRLYTLNWMIGAMEELLDQDMGLGVDHPDFMDVLIPDKAQDPVNFDVALGLADQVKGLALGQDHVQGAGHGDAADMQEVAGNA
ncbi:hypothetical protein ACET3Z_024912 [Daucus carota]